MDRSTLRALGMVWGIGFAVAAALIVPALGGLWLDGRLGTAPLFLLVGLGLGLAAVVGLIAELLAFRSGRGGRLLRRRSPDVTADEAGREEG